MSGDSTSQLPPARAHLLERQRSYLQAASRPDASAAPDRARLLGTPRFHVATVATGWRSAFGGLNTLNRELCSAMAAAGSRVVCVVPRAEPAEAAEARARQVDLVEAEWLPDGDAVPRWPRGFSPDFVIGHGRVTGLAAQRMANRLPGCRRLHVLHVAPDEIDPLKPEREYDQGTSSEKRAQAELELGREAYRVIAVGPRLHRRYLTEFGREAGPRLLELDPGFDPATSPVPGPPQGAPWRILLFGRAEDAELKGLDIGVRASALAANWLTPQFADIEFWVRGAPEGYTDVLRDQLRTWAGNRDMRIVVRTFTTDPAELRQDLERASLILMPSRAEGFGLTGLEAITAGIPALVSNASGLGLLLGKLLPEEVMHRTVVPVDGSFSAASQRWARSIHAVIRHREAAFEQARGTREYLGTRHTWSTAAISLLNSL